MKNNKLRMLIHPEGKEGDLRRRIQRAVAILEAFGMDIRR